eukprot:COSAG05_NODE_22120_length_267_cov_0.607143_1_plen_28_part_01
MPLEFYTCAMFAILQHNMDKLRVLKTDG